MKLAKKERLRLAVLHVCFIHFHLHFKGNSQTIELNKSMSMVVGIGVICSGDWSYLSTVVVVVVSDWLVFGSIVVAVVDDDWSSVVMIGSPVVVVAVVWFSDVVAPLFMEQAVLYGGLMGA